MQIWEKEAQRATCVQWRFNGINASRLIEQETGR